MRGISGLLQIIGLVVVLVAGYWFYYVNWGTSSNDRIAATIAPMLPTPFRDWGCGKLAGRLGATEAPTFCSPVANSAPAPTPESGGRL
ncbi:hypothetical protein ACFQI3_08955 [Hansschlegelia quercus]|uniref:Uncharacterized protein n=1 Tax=Hansschlegelia quercus TaxID=2528245 RepID=A0A4Q9GM67_9HYPH|nr:hypothetical protein [Hansschlegelia quercus]TBN54215.1 hypothetical protein EYR15_05030 [Hansschlegelia quercus]